MKNTLTQLLIAASILSATVGCNSLKKQNGESVLPKIDLPKIDMPSVSSLTSKYSEPASMAVIWKDTVYTAPGTRPTRGFGGRIYFYDKKQKPVRVDGDISIYAFDDSNESENKSQPDRKFEYRQTELQGHYSETELGPSYSIWVPWDAAGGERKTISLLPIFKSVKGTVCKSGQDLVVLPGTSTQADLEAEEDQKILEQMKLGIFPENGAVSTSKREFPVNQVDFAQQLAEAKAKHQKNFNVQQVSHVGSDMPNNRLRTTSIQMTRSMQNHLAELPPQQPFSQSQLQNRMNTLHQNIQQQKAELAQQKMNPRRQSNATTSQNTDGIPPGVNPYVYQRMKMQNKLSELPSKKTLPANNSQQNLGTSQAGQPGVPSNSGIQTPNYPGFGVPGSFR